MEKDPAFLFYSKDYYEGTRMMLPEERACYVDLMVYQQQHGAIPTDLKRVLMYCSGVTQATLEGVLEAKFKLTDKGWINEKLEKVILCREEYSSKQSINGTVGQIWKKAKAFLTKKEYSDLRELLNNYTNEDVFELFEGKETNKATLIATLEGLLNGSLKHLENANAIVNKEEDIIDNSLLIIDEFEKFWNLYDKKVGEKEKLLSKWAKLKPIERNKIFETLPKYVASAEKKYRKNPETYLNNKAWNDEIITETKVPEQTKPKGAMI